jgi:hypothetical protein
MLRLQTKSVDHEHLHPAYVDVWRKIMNTVYLPKEMMSWLGELGKTARSPNAKVCYLNCWISSNVNREWCRAKAARLVKPEPIGNASHLPNLEPLEQQSAVLPSVIHVHALIMFPVHRKPQKKKRKQDFDEDDEDEDDDDSAGSSDEAASKSGSNPPSDDEDEGASDEGNLGRGARGRAKVGVPRSAL